MELKDVILATIAEIGEESAEAPIIEESKKASPQEPIESPRTKEESIPKAPQRGGDSEDERLFLEQLKERLLVLFEGFQSPNNKAVEAKVDLTINFLEYLLALIEERLERLNRD